MKNSDISETSLIHEIGHWFDLVHTHGPSNEVRTNELVDGSDYSMSWAGNITFNGFARFLKTPLPS